MPARGRAPLVPSLRPLREGGWSTLSRRNQQRKRRQRTFDPLKAAGYDTRPHKHSIWWRMLHNQWIVFGGIGVIAFFTVFGTCLGANSGTTSNGDQTLDFNTAT